LFALTFTIFPMIKFDLSKTNFAKQTSLSRRILPVSPGWAAFGRRHSR